MAKNRSNRSAKTASPKGGAGNRAAKAERKANRSVSRGLSARGAFEVGAPAVSSGSRTMYEAASRSERVAHVADHGPNGGVGELERIRARARHAVRNNPHAKHALWVLVSNIVGYGIKPLTPFPELNELWEDWEEEVGFYRKQALICSTFLQSGEGFARFRERRDGDMDSVPLDVQLYEPDHVPLHNDMPAPNGNNVFASLEEDLIGRIVAFHMYLRHPNDFTGLPHDFTTHRVPASEIMHVFLEERPGQRRGVPTFAAALNTLDSLGTYDDAELERKKGAAMYGGFYRRPLDSDGDIPEAFDTDDENILLQPLRPNTFLELPVGYEVELSQPPSTDANYPNFRRAQLAAVAVSLHMTFEHITWDFEKLGDRQYRAAMLEFVRLMEMFQYHVVIDLFCKPTWKRFVQTAILSGKWTPPAGARPRDYLRCEWTPPARGYVHPVQDIEAYAAAIRAGITSRKRVAGQLGEDVRRIDLENAADQAHAESLELRYSTYVGQDADQGENTLPTTAASAAMAAAVEAEALDEVGRLETAATA